MPGTKTYRETALVLKKTKLKETDVILTMLAHTGRQIRAVAKGARKPGSRLAARCDLCCIVDALFAKGRNLDIVSQAELIAAPLGAAPSYELLSAASVINDIALLASSEDIEDPFLFAITTRVLELLAQVSSSTQFDMLVAAYIFKVVSHMGYRPDWDSCVSCGDVSVSYISTAAGGSLCASCAHSVAGAEEVDASLFSWLTFYINASFTQLLSTELDAVSATTLLHIAHMWAETHLDTRIRSLEFSLSL
ncbi:DNA repair protein RecO [Collinsella sp. zg1085]|uniref:DNA repair protein RecO n=1 Tax=Collinsella sp. zg1085 TaxID=2844380 RepID=UPI001C0C7B24|nr:DNA repair protein RecO [Collinsella sp. zg1085]QWT16985.1 DNA repair protein RecO [Collinsella sp. zg1085]